MHNCNSLPDPILVNVCEHYEPFPARLSLEQLTLRDRLLSKYVGPNPNDDLLGKQRLSINAGVTSLLEDKNFLLADGMGMGKTAQAKVIAELLLSAGKIDRVIVVPAPGGSESWSDFPCSTKTVNEFLLGCAKYDKRTLAIVDELHRFKGSDSIAGTFLSTYGDPTKRIACHCPILGMSGTLVDKQEEMAGYTRLFGLDKVLNGRGNIAAKSPSKEILDELHARGQLAMRSLEYPHFGLSTSKFDVPLADLDDMMAKSQYDPTVFTYALCLERYYLQNHLRQDIVASLDSDRVPVVLTSQINIPVEDVPVAEYIASLVESVGGTPVFLDEHPINDPIAGLHVPKPVLFGTMQSLGTGSNLQDTIGAYPRDLLVTGISFGVNDIIQACYRVLRPNSLSVPSIVLPISDHPVHKFAFGCIAKKLDEHPNTDATFSGICDFMSGYAPLSSTLRESSLLFLKAAPVLTAPLRAMFVKCAGLYPTIRGNRRVFKASDLGIPNYKDLCLDKYRSGGFSSVFGMDERSDHFWISLYKSEQFNSAWNIYVQSLFKE